MSEKESRVSKYNCIAQGTLSVRFNKSEIEKIEEIFDEISASNIELSGKDIIWKLSDVALSKVPIQHKALQGELDNAREIIKALQKDVNENILLKDEEIKFLKSELKRLQANPNIQIKEIEKVVEKSLSQNDVLIQFTDQHTEILQAICKNESIRVKKDITPDLLLKKMFVDYVKYGPMDFFSMPASIINKIQEKYKNQK